jgi:Ran GTPase-activating protein (RanGAP) involved in mRNA processing and transport
MEPNQIDKLRRENRQKLDDCTFNELFYSSLGLEHFAIALADTERLTELDLSQNDLGPNFELLQKIFKKNVNIEFLNLADCDIAGDQIQTLCESLMLNQKLKYLYLRNSNLDLVGSEYISKLILGNKTLIELDLYNCSINEAGGALVGAALK